jgi:pyruvate kinase
MLSDETAMGKYPIEAVQVMKRVIRYAQQNPVLKTVFNDEAIDAHSRQGAISSAIIHLADAVEASAIVAETKTGATALNIAARRPNRPIIAITSTSRVAQQLAILYGCKSFVRKEEQLQTQKLADWLKTHKVFKKGDVIVTVSGQYPGVVGATDTIRVRAL